MISHIDHIVLTVRDIEKSVEFFTKTLGMSSVTYSNGRRAVAFGNQKINFNVVGQEVRNHALEGSGDVCLVANVGLEQMQSHLAALHIEILEGPVKRNGAQGEMQSLYINDLDNNLIEISFYPTQENTDSTPHSNEENKKQETKTTAPENSTADQEPVQEQKESRKPKATPAKSAKTKRASTKNSKTVRGNSTKGSSAKSSASKSTSDS